MLSWDDYEEPAPEPVVALHAQAQSPRDDRIERAAVAPAPTAAPVASRTVAATPPSTGAAHAEVELPKTQGAMPDATALQKAQAAVAALDPKAEFRAIEGSLERVTVDQKRMINCRADLNQLVPFKYEWAWQKYLDGCAN